MPSASSESCSPASALLVCAMAVSTRNIPSSSVVTTWVFVYYQCNALTQAHLDQSPYQPQRRSSRPSLRLFAQQLDKLCHAQRESVTFRLSSSFLRWKEQRRQCGQCLVANYSSGMAQ